jgi:predicted amidophosphoribosyltransferase
LAEDSEEYESSSDEMTHKTDNEEDREVADIFTDLLGMLLLKNKKPKQPTPRPINTT